MNNTMKKIIASFIIITIFVYCKSSSNNLCIKNKNEALVKAERILIKKYGEKVISEEHPLIVELKNDSIWYITGTLHAEKGGVAHLKLNKKNCRIIEIYHEK